VIARGLEREAGPKDGAPPPTGAVGHRHDLTGSQTEDALDVVAVGVGERGSVEIVDEDVRGRGHHRSPT
jgi:hypothetical protein